MYFAQARYYDYEVGRFNRIDPIRDGENFYVYVGGNPVSWVDLDGQFVITATAAAIIAVGTVLIGGTTYYVITNEDFQRSYSEATREVELIINEAGLIIDYYVINPVIDYAVDSVTMPSIDISTNTETMSKELGDIAGSYENLQCVEAAEAMKAHLQKNNERGKIIEIKYTGGRGYIVSISKNDKVISENGVHRGIEYKGLMYCNVHPQGVSKELWIADFEAFGIRTITEIPF